MDKGKKESVWERTNVTNLLRNRDSGTYYARVKVGNKQKWRTLKTNVFSVAKLRLGDAEKEMRSRGSPAGAGGAGARDGMNVSVFVTTLRAKIDADSSLAPATKTRRGVALAALEKTWPDLPYRDVRRVTAADCEAWASKALRTGTGHARTNVTGMSSSAFNKMLDAARAVFEVARDQGIIYKNPVDAIAKAPPKKKRLALPSPTQFAAIVQAILVKKSRWAPACAEVVELLAYSGVRIEEGRSLRWSHVDVAKNQLLVPGTKTETSYRVIPIFPALVKFLHGLREKRGPEAADAPILQVGTSLGALATACRAVGVAKLTHHDLRHLFATRCIESGVDIPTVSRWLGHSDGGALAMRTYGHLRQEHSQVQAAKVSFG